MTIGHRIRFTPLRDVLRGKLTARLDWRGRVERSQLPTDAKDLIVRVVNKTRLRALEKSEVADELISHFLDGIQADVPSEKLIKSFGDETVAAKLIRRAKKRNRSIAYKFFAFVRWTLLACVLFYIAAAIPFFVSKPSIKINYIAKWNEPILATNPADRAWPIYRDLLLRLPPQDSKEDHFWYVVGDSYFNQATWPALAMWVNLHADDLAELRRAAAKPVMGFIFGAGGSQNDPAVFPDSVNWQTSTSPPDVIATLLPFLNPMRSLALLLQADAEVARQDKDAARCAADINAIFNMGRQASPQDVLITQFVFQGVRIIGLQELKRTLTTQPALWSDQTLVDFAHMLGQCRTASDLMSYSGERVTVLDNIQRYSDDGRGHGHLTAQGLLRLQMLRSNDSEVGVLGASFAVAPVLQFAAPSRSQATEDFNRLMDQSEANLHLPMRDAHWSQLEMQIRGVRSASSAALNPVAVLMPSLMRSQSSVERYLGERDGLLVAIACEIYRRHHDGNYPSDLASLVPQYLPELPVDRITGEPLHYRIENNSPLIYSVGADRKDDGGTVPLNAKGDRIRTALWDSDVKEIPQGDWILFPPQPN